MVKNGKPCYLIMCIAADVNQSPRTVKDFIEDSVFEGGKVTELHGDSFIEMRNRVRVDKIVKNFA